MHNQYTRMHSSPTPPATTHLWSLLGQRVEAAKGDESICQRGQRRHGGRVVGGGVAQEAAGQADELLCKWAVKKKMNEIGIEPGADQAGRGRCSTGSSRADGRAPLRAIHSSAIVIPCDDCTTERVPVELCRVSSGWQLAFTKNRHLHTPKTSACL